jgi:hypothetical protein
MQKLNLTETFMLTDIVNQQISTKLNQITIENRQVVYDLMVLSRFSQQLLSNLTLEQFYDIYKDSITQAFK